jgi:hypothetical protein
MKLSALLARLTFSALVVATTAAQNAPRSVGTVVAGGAVVTVDASGPSTTPAPLRLTAEHRRGGTRCRHRGTIQGATTIDAAGSIVIPGLINAHTHAPMVLYRAWPTICAAGMAREYIFPAEAKTVSREMVRAGTRLAALEMIQSGTTLYADMYYFEEEIARRQSGGHARRAGSDHHPVSGGRREDAGRGSRADRSLPQGICERRSHRPGCCAAFTVYGRREDAPGVACPGAKYGAP